MDSAPVQVVIECGNARQVHVCGSGRQWAKIAEALRLLLAETTRGNHCASAVVSIHFDDERCCHER